MHINKRTGSRNNFSFQSTHIHMADIRVQSFIFQNESPEFHVSIMQNYVFSLK